MSEHPFDRLNRTYHERHAAFAETQYEEGRVNFLLKALKIPKLAATLRRRHDEETGQPRLTFYTFNSTFPSFPVLLGASTLDGVKLHLDKYSLLPALFNNFSQAKFVRCYEDFFEQHVARADGRSIGLVFPRKGVRQGLVIYNEGLEAIPYHGSTWVYSGGDKNQPRLLFVRPFQSLLEAIYDGGHGWRPS